MPEKILGALKSIAPFAVSLGVIGINAAFGSPVDVNEVRTLVIGAFTSLVVYFIPNLHTQGPQEPADVSLRDV